VQKFDRELSLEAALKVRVWGLKVLYAMGSVLVTLFVSLAGLGLTYAEQHPGWSSSRCKPGYR
jgi:hypothetical protein